MTEHLLTVKSKELEAAKAAAVEAERKNQRSISLVCYASTP